MEEGRERPPTETHKPAGWRLSRPLVGKLVKRHRGQRDVRTFLSSATAGHVAVSGQPWPVFAVLPDGELL
jgi:hypothetical protein